MIYLPCVLFLFNFHFIATTLLFLISNMENLTNSEFMFLDALPSAPNIPNQFVDSTAEQLFDPVIPINILEIENSNGYSITSTFILNPINSNSAMLILVTFLNQSTFNFLDSLSSVPNFLSFGGFTTEQFFHLKISIDFPETNFHEITIFHYS